MISVFFSPHPLLSLHNATCNSPSFFFSFFFWVVMLKLLPKGFWPNFALRYAHSTAGEISGLFACKLEEGIWLHRQHFPSGHTVHAHQLFGPALQTPWPRGSQIPRPPQVTYQNLRTGELHRRHTSALGAGGGNTPVWHASTEAGCWLCSPGLHHLLGHNPAQLHVGSQHRGKLSLHIKNVHYPHVEDQPGVMVDG